MRCVSRGHDVTAAAGAVRFNVTMILRTYYVKGLLLYITNPQRTAYLAIQLADDQLSIVYSADMLTVDTVNSSARVTDGAWHSVSQSTSCSLLLVAIQHFSLRLSHLAKFRAIAQFAITINSNVCPHIRVLNTLMRESYA